MKPIGCVFVTSATILAIGVLLALHRAEIAEFACSRLRPEPETAEAPPRRPRYLLHLNKNVMTLSAVDAVLHRLGYEKINVTGLRPSEYPADWDIFWSFQHHDRIKREVDFTATKFHQKLNHFPGNYVLVSKSVLATQTKLKFIPRAFLNSRDVQEFALRNPHKRFVVKRKGNRGVRLTQPAAMNFTKSPAMDGYFAQEFVERPLLWNGHKFDFSIFVVVTSVSPLRLYYYAKNVNLRFCQKPYDTSDPDDVHSYVIGTDILPAQQFEGTRHFVNNDYTYRDAFEAMMRAKGANLEDVWRRVEELITHVVMTKERSFFHGIENFGTQKFSHFELYRFDMMFNEDFELFLLEVNMSPNLLASSKISKHKPFFENLLYNLFNLIGVGATFKQEDFRFPDLDVEMMVANPNGMTIKPEICLKRPCIRSCEDPVCKVCWHCHSVNEKFEKIQAYREQMNLGDFKRLFPPSRETFDQLPRSLVNELMDDSVTHAEWFFEMCKKNRNFC